MSEATLRRKIEIEEFLGYAKIHTAHHIAIFVDVSDVPRTFLSFFLAFASFASFQAFPAPSCHALIVASPSSSACRPAYPSSRSSVISSNAVEGNDRGMDLLRGEAPSREFYKSWDILDL